MEHLTSLAQHWRTQAAQYEADGVTAGAQLLRRVATELETTAGGWWVEALTLQQAAEETGRSYDSLQRAVRDGTLPDAGRKYRPRIRRCDLYRPRPDGPDTLALVPPSEV